MLLLIFLAISLFVFVFVSGIIIGMAYGISSVRSLIQSNKLWRCDCGSLFFGIYQDAWVEVKKCCGEIAEAEIEVDKRVKFLDTPGLRR